MAIDKKITYEMQGGVKNYLGKQKQVKAPLKWQSGPDKPLVQMMMEVVVVVMEILEENEVQTEIEVKQLVNLLPITKVVMMDLEVPLSWVLQLEQ